MMHTRSFDITAAFRFGGTFEDPIGLYREYIAQLVFDYASGHEMEFGIDIHYVETICDPDSGIDRCISRLIVFIEGQCDDKFDLEGFRVYLKGLDSCSLSDFEARHLRSGHSDSPTPFWIASMDDPEYHERHKRQYSMPD